MRTARLGICLVTVCLAAGAAPTNAQAPSWTHLRWGLSGLDGERLSRRYALGPASAPLYEVSPPGVFTAAPAGGDVFQAGQPIPLLLTVTNTYDVPLWLYHREGERTDYDYRVQRRVRPGVLRDAPLTALGRDVLAPDAPLPGSVSVWGLGLRPGHSRSERVLIDRLFDMTAPGTYTVRVVRRALGVKRPGSFSLAAPPLEVEVSAAPP